MQKGAAARPGPTDKEHKPVGRRGGVGREGRGYKGILTWIWVQDLTEQLRADRPSRPAHNCSGWTQTWSDRAFIALRKLWTMLDTFSLLESILILISYYVIFLHSKAYIPPERETIRVGL